MGSASNVYLQQAASAASNTMKQPDLFLLTVQLLFGIMLPCILFLSDELDGKHMIAVVASTLVRTGLLWLMKKAIRKAKSSGTLILSKLVITYGLLLIIMHGVMYTLLDAWFPGKNNSSNFTVDKKLTLGNGLYFALVTGSTVGYGDINPKTTGAKLMVMNQIVSQVIFAGELLTPN